MTTKSPDTIGAPATLSPSRSAQRSKFRPDIQALRALAVGLVVLNHLWPLRLPGGFVGVDVFFVISGFLISSHLLRELEASGRVRLSAFYSRRARRLFPAAFLVLAASMFLAMVFLPYTRWITTAQEVVASIFYSENWVLAAKSVDYSAATASASAVQHYWSLSVEEQFYLFWPLALILAALIARKLQRPLRRVLLLTVVSVALMSLACSIFVTSAMPQQAYFATPVRVWEFAVGALIGLVAGRALPINVKNLLGVLGFALIILSAWTFDSATAFPGWTALLPVAGTAMVILAGAGEGRLVYSRVAEFAPIQLAGKISYSLYLWHWPLIVAAPFVLGFVPTAPTKVLILVVSVLLAWVTKMYIEDIWINRSGRRSKIRWKGFRAPIAGMAALSVIAGIFGIAGHYKEASATELAAAGAAGPCYGPAAVGNRDCGDGFSNAVPVPDMGKENEYWHIPEECVREDKLLEGAGPALCDFSKGNAAAEVVWLIGDSHAQQWQEAIFQIASKNGWILKYSYRGGCPPVDVPLTSFNGVVLDDGSVQSCSEWSETVRDAMESDRPSRVFVSTFAVREVIEDGSGAPQVEQYSAAFSRIWREWANLGISVYPIVDVPLNGAVRSEDCLSLNSHAPRSCAAPRNEAIEFEPVGPAVEALNDERVKLVDMTSYFCDQESCFNAAGGVAIYYDVNHLNRLYVRALVPYIEGMID